MSDAQIYQLALSKIDGIGTKLGKQLIAYCGGVRHIFNTSKRKLLKIPGIGIHLADQIYNADPLQLAEKDYLYHQARGHEILFFLDERYPDRLKNYDDAPLLLYAKSNFNPHHPRTVAIVGTRRPDNYGRDTCKAIVSQLSTMNVQILSGMAYGIDSIVHKTALNHGIENIAIMGTGLDTIYPASHRKLAEQICRNGTLITEYPIRMRTDKENFPRRNRIIAAMSDAVIVIQSRQKGGSLITAEFANNYYKDVFAVPGRLGDTNSIGCNKLIKQNKAHLIESVEDLAYIMNWNNHKDPVNNNQTKLFVDVSPEEQKILDALASEQVSIDDLHHALQISLSQLSSTLLGLECKNLVSALPGKQYRRI